MNDTEITWIVAVSFNLKKRVKYGDKYVTIATNIVEQFVIYKENCVKLKKRVTHLSIRFLRVKTVLSLIYYLKDFSIWIL